MNSIREGIESLVQDTVINVYDNIGPVFAGRVIFVLLDDSDKDRFSKYGGLAGIGTIECEVVKDGNIFKSNVVVAKPINRNITRYPLVNEIVKIESAPNFSNQTFSNQYQTSYYYSDIIGTWDNIEHNITPVSDNVRKKSQKDNVNSYMNASSGIQKTNNSSNINKVDKIEVEEFKERGDVRALQPNPGDVIFQGRFGNSIRFSASNEKKKGSPLLGTDGRPTLLIRNGQGKDIKGDIWNPVYENINKDGSSLYMLSGHKIEFDYASKNFESLGTKPKDISKIVEPIKTTDKKNSVNKSDDISTGSINKYKSNPVSESVDKEDDIQFLPDYEDQINSTPAFDDFKSFVPGSDFTANKVISINVNYAVLGNPYTTSAKVLDPDKYLTAIFGNERGNTGQKSTLGGSATGKYQITKETRQGIYSQYYRNSMTIDEFETKFSSDSNFEYQVARKLAINNITSSSTAAIAIGRWYDPVTAISEKWDVIPRADKGNTIRMGDYINNAAKRYR